MRRLTVIYDATCGFCVRCKEWLEREPSFLAIECLWSRSPEVARRYPGLVGPGNADLLVVSDEGGVYRGAHAWIMCLYALRGYREWSMRLASPALLPFARRAFELLSSSRGWISRVFRLSPEVVFAQAVAETRARGVSVVAAGDTARCTYCHDDAGAADARTCPECRAILHSECRDELGRCSTLGCKAAAALVLVLAAYWPLPAAISPRTMPAASVAARALSASPPSCPPPSGAGRGPSCRPDRRAPSRTPPRGRRDRGVA